MIKFIFLDLDDTILDFHRSEAVALSKTLQSLNVEPTEAVITRYSVYASTLPLRRSLKNP